MATWDQAFQERLCRGGRFPHSLSGGRGGTAAGASARRGRVAVDAGARPAEPRLPGDRVRDAGLRRSREPANANDPGSGDNDGGGGRGFGSRPVQSDGYLVWRHGRILDGGSAGGPCRRAGAGRARGDPAGGERACLRLARGDRAPALRAPGANSPAPAVEPALAARRLALVRRLRGPGTRAELEEGLRGWECRSWCCSAHKTG